MGNTRHAPRALPPRIAGGKRAVYEALHEMATDQSRDRPDTPVDEVYFRRAQLAGHSGLSTSRVAAILRWLEEQHFIKYFPGDPGNLSQVIFLPESARADNQAPTVGCP